MGPREHPGASSLIPQALIKCPLCVIPSFLLGTEDTVQSKTASFLPSREFIF